MTKRYGKTVTEQLADETLQCRQIVTEVISFGINQNQILKIIELLALNLDDHNKLKKIAEAVKELQDSTLLETQDDELLKDSNG